jgi:digalactosyldiacylglycerol synthase
LLLLPLLLLLLLLLLSQRDVAILEEPEHLNWFQHSSRWSRAFKHVVGIM